MKWRKICAKPDGEIEQVGPHQVYAIRSLRSGEWFAYKVLADGEEPEMISTLNRSYPKPLGAGRTRELAIIAAASRLGYTPDEEV